MTDRNVIFLRLSPEEKVVIAAAAAREKRSLNTYVLNAAVERARHDLKGLAANLPLPLQRACRHCGRPLTRGNKSDFCRVCQRTVGLPTLRKIHTKEVVSHGKSTSPPARRSRKSD